MLVPRSTTAMITFATANTIILAAIVTVDATTDQETA